MFWSVEFEQITTIKKMDVCSCFTAFPLYVDSPWGSCDTAYRSWLTSGQCPKLFEYCNKTLISKGPFCSQQNFTESISASAGSDWASCSPASVDYPLLNCLYIFYASPYAYTYYNVSHLELLKYVCPPGIFKFFSFF